MTLGMLWTIILRFAIQDISVDEFSAKEGLLLWCQRKTTPYKNVNITNFHMSFKDGLAFCALIHRHRPDLIDYSKLSKDDPMHNLNYAFDVAEEHLDIPKMLDAEDMVNEIKPDERAVMTYVSCYYHAFSSSQQAETAAKRIGKALNVNQGNEKSIGEYERLTSDLLDWMAKKIPDLNDRTDKGYEDMQNRLNDYRKYKAEEKPPKVDDKASLENLYNTLQTKLRLSNRPIYMPSEGKLVSDVDKAWKDLEQAEKDFQDWILAQLRRMERLDHLAQKFKHKCDIHETWCGGQEEYLTGDDIGTDNLLPNLLAMQKRHEAFESDLAAQQDRVEQIVAIAQELNTLGYSKVEEVNTRCQQITDKWNEFGELTGKRGEKLKSEIERAERLDNLWLEFAKRASPFNNWMDGAKEDLLDTFKVNTVDEIQDLKYVQEKFKANMPAAKSEYESILALQQEIDAMSLLHNPYTNTKAEDLQSKWTEIQEIIPKRDNDLNVETTVQQNNERLRIEFAEMANQIGEWIAQRTKKMTHIGLNERGTLEDHQTALQALDEEINGFKERITELNDINNTVQEAMIFENPHTPLTMEIIRIRFEQLLTGCTRNINEVENQILMRDSFGISEDQMKELRASFNHFDKNGSGQLDYGELRQCLVSLGQNITSDTDDKDFKNVVGIVDPNGSGIISFQAFLDFMTREMADIDTANQVIESFRILAADKLYITADELRRELPPDQAEYCIARMGKVEGEGVPEGALDYRSFSNALYGESDL